MAIDLQKRVSFDKQGNSDSTVNPKIAPLDSLRTLADRRMQTSHPTSGHVSISPQFVSVINSICM